MIKKFWKFLAIDLFIEGSYLSFYLFLIWQFDHTIADFVWNNPDGWKNYIDMWVFGEFFIGRRFVSAIDVYNTCVFFMILMPIFMFVTPIILHYLAFRTQKE